MLSIVPRGLVPASPEQLVAVAPELQAMPVVAQKLMSMLRDEDSSVERIAQLLGTDQALVAAVLRYANSARGMPARRIGNLREAVARIGRRPLSEVVVRACTGPMLDRGLPPYALPRSIAWRHAATASVASRGLAKLVKVCCDEEASVAGLLHDVGKAVLTSVVPEHAAEAVSVARSRRVQVWQAELQVMGFHHGHVGATLMRAWSLPEQLSEAVEFHHEPDATTNQLARVVSLADAAAAAVGAVGGGGACLQPSWDESGAEALGATPKQLAAFLERLGCVEEGELT